MWIYEKKLEFPIQIKRPDARLAKIMIEQYGGCDGEIGAALRYLSQKFSMVTPEAKATLNDIATEELAHVEMMGTIVHQLTQGLTKDQIIDSGLDTYYVNHGFGVFPSSAAGVPFTAAAFQSKGDPLTDLYEDMAAEQKARSTYEYLIDLTDDPDVLAPLRFLREREVVHFQRFGEALDIARDYLNQNHYFFMNGMKNNTTNGSVTGSMNGSGSNATNRSMTGSGNNAMHPSMNGSMNHAGNHITKQSK